MNIEKVILDSLEKMTVEFEKRKSFFMSVLYRNIDELAKHAGIWFGENVPQEFKDVMSSLMSLSIEFYDDIDKYRNIFIEQTYEPFDPVAEIHDVTERFSAIIGNDFVSIDSDDILMINTAKSIFNDSVFSIMLCMAQFFNEKSMCYVKTSREYTSVRLLFEFTDLSDGIDDFNKLTKPFFSTEDDMRLKVGLNIPFENIRKIGGVVNIYESNHFSQIQIAMSFPSDEFLQTVSDIRKIYVSPADRKKRGTILLIVSDKILELVLRDNIEDRGYSTEVSGIEKIDFAVGKYNPNVVIIYGSDIVKKYGTFDTFLRKRKFGMHTIIICTEKNKCVPDEKLNPEIGIINFPFEIDELIGKLENV